MNSDHVLSHPARRAFCLAGSGALALALAGCLGSEPSNRGRPAYYADLAAPGAQLDPATTSQIINAYRANAGLAPLQWDASLVSVAEREAGRLADKGEVRELPDSGLDRGLDAAGFRSKRVMRSISGGYHSFADAFSGWRGARHHDAVLKMPDGQKFGIAAVARPNSRHRVYWILLVAGT